MTIPTAPRTRRSIVLCVVAVLAALHPCTTIVRAAAPPARGTRLQPTASTEIVSGTDTAVAKTADPRPEPLDPQRAGALLGLYKQMEAGAPFSAEEALILNRFAGDLGVTELEADVVVSRALYAAYVAGTPLDREQERLLDEYSAVAAVREHDIADRKAEDLARREAEAATHPRAPEAVPTNDTCDGAEVIPAAGPFPYLTAVTADITDATTSGDPAIPSCTFNGGPVSRSVWYTFTPSTTGVYIISDCADAPTGTTVDDTVMGIYTSTGGCAGPFTEIPTSGTSDGCDDDTCASEALQSVITTTLTAGTAYYLVVWLVGTPPPTAGNTAVQLRVSQVLPPANDTCAGATPLALGVPAAGLINNLTANDYQVAISPSCFTGPNNTLTTAPGRDVVYSFTPAASGSYSFRVKNYAQTSLVVYTTAGACPAGTAPITIATTLPLGPPAPCANRNSVATQGEEVFCQSLTAGTTYLVFVDESVATVGSGFTIEVTPCARETESNGTTATANAPSCATEGSISPGADVDFYALGTLAAGQRIFAMVDGVAGSSTDFDLRVTTATDTLEYDDANNDVPFGSLSPNVAGTVAQAAPTFLRVNVLSAAVQSEPYRLHYVVQPSSASATPEVEPNNTIAQANAAGTYYYSGALSASSDTDVFAFTAAAGDLVFLGADFDPTLAAGTPASSSPINGALAVLNAAGTVLAAANDTGATSNAAVGTASLTATTPNKPAEAIAFRVPATGVYYARVTTTTVAGGDYLLSVSDNCATGQPAPAVSIGDVAVVEGNSGTTAATFAVSLSLPSAQTVMVSYATASDTATAGDYVATAGTLTFAPFTTTQTLDVSIVGDLATEPDETFSVTLTNPVNATVADGSGTGTILNDDSPCSLVCPADVTQANDPSQCGAVVAYPAPTVTGSCGAVTCSPASGSFFPVGTTSVTCAAEEGSTCAFTVTVADAEAPAVTCPVNVSVGTDPNQCGAVVSYATPTATDNCGTASSSCSPASGSFFATGTTTVTCTATDATGNTGSCTFTVTVGDTDPPSLKCPANISAPNAPNQCGANVTFATPTATDNCSVATVTCSPASGSFFPKGTTTVTCTATDASNNTASCAFTVAVVDTQPPAIACPPSLAVASAPGQCGAVVAYQAPVVSDNCPGVTVACAPASGSLFPKGTTTVTCTATDGAANAVSCAFTVTVTDAQPPSIACPPAQVSTATTMQGGVPGANVVYPAPVVSDNCPGAAAPVCTPASGSFFPQGTTTVTCTTADAAGNAASCGFTVTVGVVFTTCVVDDATGAVLSIVADPTSPLYGFWQFRPSPAARALQGTAEYVRYVPGRSLVAYDHNDPTVRMDVTVNYSARTATATIVNLTSGARYLVRDRDIANDPPCR